MAHKKVDVLDKGGASISKKRSLKQQIRDIQRLLSKLIVNVLFFSHIAGNLDDLPETVRLTKERILKSLQDELNDKTSQKQRQKLAKKYRMVKFFDRRKVLRKLSRACREYQAENLEEPERSELLDEIHRLRRELNYIVHFPLSEKYIALYPSSSPSSESALAKQEELLLSIVDTVEKGDLPDAVLLEKELTLPDDLVSSKKSCEASLLTDSVGDDVKRKSHEMKHEKRISKKKRQAAEVEDEGVALAVESGRKKLKQDGFFLVDNN